MRPTVDNKIDKARVLDLANHIGMKKAGSKKAYTYTDPEYRILEPVVTEDMADVGVNLKFREPRSAEDVAPLCGRSVEETSQLLWDLAMAGVCFVNDIDGVDKYWLETWIPGVMEMMVNNKENVSKYPQIAQSFEEYGRVRGPMTAGKFPVGKGLMRVIPIETAIDGNSKSASFEEVSKYLYDNDVFSVSDCACRTSREILGEGCGHLKEDMCIQLGHAAEYYIRTGRGREITRDEAFDIIKRAEENGLMHQIPNVDGFEKTHAICNCCSCSCYSLRTATMFLNNDMVRSNYVAQVDPENCVACGQCVIHCPTNALKLGQKLCGDAQDFKQRVDLPSNSKWGPENWNPDYRTNRENVLDSGTSPCITECPAHIPVQGYIKLASQGKYTEALELIKKVNPFPAVCGRICPRTCESACTRGSIDEPVAIDDIKRFIAEQDLNNDVRFIPKKRHDYGKKIAIVGAGPSGLSCAYYLAVDGYNVTVFEKQNALGGMLTLGIPSYRLEKNVVNAEIDILKEMGVEFKTGVEVGKDVSLDDLRNQGYEAFYLAIGAQAGRKLGVEGEDAEGVISGVDFLLNVNLGKEVDMTGDIVVIGGGNVAIDVARTATRAGASTVQMFCLEDEKTMPALDEEVEEALSEDIVINNSWGPKRVLVEDGKVVGIEFKKCLSVFDENKRFNPKYDEEDIKVVKADKILLSIGQAIDWGGILEGSKVELNPNNTIKVDPKTLQTAEPDIFAGGDAATGPKFAIDAIALGLEGAISIHRFVHPGQDLLFGRDRKEYRAFDKANLELDGYDRIPRERTRAIDGQKAKVTFSDLRDTFTEEQIRKETERCLSCGATVVDEYICVGCGQCTTKCKFDAISLVKKYDAKNVSFEELKPEVMKNVVKRTGRMAVHSVKKGLGMYD